jgi:hypothetical protein
MTGYNSDDVATDFGIIMADGAYVQGKDEYTRLLFYRDTAFPRRTSDDKYTFNDPNREILHEVRLPYKSAKIIGMYLTASATIHEDMLREERTVEPEHSTSTETPKTTSRFMDLVYKLVQIVGPMDETGEDKAITYIEEWLKQSKPKFDELIAQHPGKVAVK